MPRSSYLEEIYENMLSGNPNLDMKGSIKQLKMFYEFLDEGNYFTASQMYNKMNNKLASMVPDEVITHMDEVVSKQKEA